MRKSYTCHAPVVYHLKQYKTHLHLPLIDRNTTKTRVSLFKKHTPSIYITSKTCKHFHILLVTGWYNKTNRPFDTDQPSYPYLNIRQVPYKSPPFLKILAHFHSILILCMFIS